VLVTNLENHPDFPTDTWFPTDLLDKHYVLKGNITRKAMEILMQWPGTGKLTRSLIQSNIDRCATLRDEDCYVLEHDISFRFLIYERI
jgi:hypothetical protein